MQFINLTKPSVLEIAGFLTLGYLFVYKPAKFSLKWLRNNCSCVSKQILKPGEHDYAVVTGASDGIGLEYARQLAEKGYNLMLLSRTEDKLIRVAAEIQAQYPQCKNIEMMAVDFCRTDIYDDIKHKLESLPGSIHVLVNNVGMANRIPIYFANCRDGFHFELINTNIVSVTMMSQIVLRIMKKQELPQCVNPAKGVIINISCHVGSTALPLFSTYCASKAYMNCLGKSLAYEYAEDGIVIQTVTPNQVNTKLVSNLHNANVCVSARGSVRRALSTVGVERQTNGHPRHKFINCANEWLEWLLCESTFMGAKLNTAKQLKTDYENKLQNA